MEIYQLSLDDIQQANRVAVQPSRTAYIDECGNFGFDFDKENVSSHYVVCAVVVNNSSIPYIENKVTEFQKKYFGQGEMKSSLISNNHSRRARILTELLLLDYSLIILIADKKAFYEDSPLKDYKGTFVKFLHRKLYDSMLSVYPKLKIIEDEYGSSEFQQGYRKYVKDHRPIPNLFNEYDFDFSDSRDSNIVQVADIIAGSVMQRIVDLKAPDVLKIFQSKIRDIINFPKILISRTVGKSSDDSFDENIYTLTNKLANDYIERNSGSDEEEIRVRTLFLRFLLYRAHNFDDSKFLYSGEIVRELSILSEKKINRDYLYRRIVAPLRDEGVLIASSSHGYKLPTCVNDIYTYVNQTISVVGPMLSRIEKCRLHISKFTDGKLDILNCAELQKYKRYFGDYQPVSTVLNEIHIREMHSLILYLQIK